MCVCVCVCAGRVEAGGPFRVGVCRRGFPGACRGEHVVVVIVPVLVVAGPVWGHRSEKTEAKVCVCVEEGGGAINEGRRRHRRRVCVCGGVVRAWLPRQQRRWTRP